MLLNTSRGFLRSVMLKMLKPPRSLCCFTQGMNGTRKSLVSFTSIERTAGKVAYSQDEVGPQIAVHLQAPRQVVGRSLQVAGGVEGTREPLHVPVSVAQCDRGTQRRALRVKQLHNPRGTLGKA